MFLFICTAHFFKNELKTQYIAIHTATGNFEKNKIQDSAPAAKEKEEEKKQERENKQKAKKHPQKEIGRLSSTHWA